MTDVESTSQHSNDGEDSTIVAKDRYPHQRCSKNSCSKKVRKLLRGKNHCSHLWQELAMESYHMMGTPLPESTCEGTNWWRILREFSTGRRPIHLVE